MQSQGSERSRLIAEYRERQRQLATEVVERPVERELNVVAALDLHFSGDLGVGAAVSMSVSDMKLIEQRTVVQNITFPYIPGLLTYREAPVCLAALRELQTRPDLLLVDGHGRAHPRRAGLACQIGVETGLPTVGVAKSILVGHHRPLAEARGSTEPITLDDETIGMALRTRAGVRPVYVSVGNLITLAEAVEWTLRLTTRYRLPEPSRRAHRLAQQAARDLPRGA